MAGQGVVKMAFHEPGDVSQGSIALLKAWWDSEFDVSRDSQLNIRSILLVDRLMRDRKSVV